MTQIILEAEIKPQDISFEDGGCSVTLAPDWKAQGGDDKIFVRIQSWDENLSDHFMYDRKNSREDNALLGHQSIQSLFGKKVRVTIEVIE